MEVSIMYEFHAKELSQTEALRQIADHAVKEIKNTVGWDADVEVNIEPEINEFVIKSSITMKTQI